MDPRDFNSLPLPACVESVEGGRVVIKAETGALYDGEGGERYQSGDAGKIFIGVDGFFLFESLSEANGRKAAAEKKAAEKKENERIRAEKLRLATASHNEAIDLPFKWVPALFIRVRMLHERGMGHGMARVSVGHILTLEDFKLGRLSRKRGEALCGKKPGFDDDLSFHGEEFCQNQMQTLRINCMGCLKKVKLLSKKNKQPQQLITPT